MGKDIKYKVTYNATKLPVGESVNLLEAFTRKQTVNDALVRRCRIKTRLTGTTDTIPPPNNTTLI